MDLWKARIRTLRKRQAAGHWENVRRIAGHIANEAREALAGMPEGKESRRQRNAANLLRHAELLQREPRRDIVDGIENWAWAFEVSEKAATGGRKSKRKPWADEIARHLSGMKYEAAWHSIPESRRPWSVNAAGQTFDVYRDGERVCAIDRTGRESSLARSSFEKYYLP